MNDKIDEEYQSSDEEIFFGPYTLKEAKQSLIPVYHRQTVGYSIKADPEDNVNTSLKLIETHSAPDISPEGDLNSPTITESQSTLGLIPDSVISDYDIHPDDSFLKLEKMVTEMCMSSDRSFNQSKFTNKHGKDYFSDISQTEGTTDNNQNNNELKSSSEIIDNHVTSTTEDEPLAFQTPLKNNYLKNTLNTPKGEIFKTPSSELKTKTPLFKTPGNPPSLKRQLQTPRRYQNVASPVATYIRNSPQVPLIKDVCPKKPLPGISSIPKLSRQIPRPNLGNKENLKLDKVNETKKDKQENTKLPTVAYRNAKETKMIDISQVNKMPQNHWAKQVASSIPRAMVVKHNHRETSSAKKPLQSRQEDSFGDLSLHQADLSVCTQKSTFTKPKKNV